MPTNNLNEMDKFIEERNYKPESREHRKPE